MKKDVFKRILRRKNLTAVLLAAILALSPLPAAAGVNEDGNKADDIDSGYAAQEVMNTEYAAGMYTDDAKAKDAIINDGAGTKTYIYGDVDLDNTLTAADALSILRYVVRLTDFDDPLVLTLADCTQDGSIGADDALFVLRCVVKLADQKYYIIENEPVESNKPDESDAPTESNMPVVSDTPIESTTPVEPSGVPTETEKPSDSDMPTESEAPVEPSESPVVSVEPSESVEPTESDQPIAGPTQTPEITTEPTTKPTDSPLPNETVIPKESTIPSESSAPVESDKPIAGPTQTPAPTATPTPTAKPTVEPTATPIIGPTQTPKPTQTPEPTQEPTATPVPTAKPTVEPTPTPTVKPTQTSTPTITPTPTPEPVKTVEPTQTPIPTATPIVGPTQTPTPEPTATPTPTIEPTAEPDVCAHDWLVTSMPVTITDQEAYDLVIHESVYKCSCGRIFDTMDELVEHQEESWNEVKQHMFGIEGHECIFDKDTKSYVCSCGFTYYTGLSGSKGSSTNYACNGCAPQTVERAKHIDAVTHEETACRVCSKCGEVRFYPCDEAECDGHEWVLSTKKVTVVDEEEHDAEVPYGVWECSCGRECYSEGSAADGIFKHQLATRAELDYHYYHWNMEGHDCTYNQDTKMWSCLCGWENYTGCGSNSVWTYYRTEHFDAVTHEENIGTIVCSKCGAVKECITPDACTHDEAYRYVEREAWDEIAEETHLFCECGYDCGSCSAEGKVTDEINTEAFSVFEAHSDAQGDNWSEHSSCSRQLTPVTIHHPETYRCALCGEYIDSNE